MGIHQDDRATLLRSSQQKLLRWIRQATGFKGEDTRERCVEGIKWIVREANDGFEDASNGWKAARWQMKRRTQVEGLLEGVLKGDNAMTKRAVEYLNNEEYKTKSELIEEKANEK